MKNDLINLVICIEMLVIIEFLTPEGKYEKHIRAAGCILFVCFALLPLIGYFTVFTKLPIPEISEAAEYYNANQASGLYSRWLSADFSQEMQEDCFRRLKEAQIEFEGDITFRIVEAAEESSGDKRDIFALIECPRDYNYNQIIDFLIDAYSLPRKNIDISITNTDGDTQ